MAMVSAADYYPFGMLMPGRATTPGEYRFGYQGQFAVKDEETGYNQFELRLWDGRLGRWLTTDPAGQYASPYFGMGNNPINRFDPDGGRDWWKFWGARKRAKSNENYVPTGTNLLSDVNVVAQSQTGNAKFWRKSQAFDRKWINKVNSYRVEFDSHADLTLGLQAGVELGPDVRFVFNAINVTLFEAHKITDGATYSYPTYNWIGSEKGTKISHSFALAALYGVHGKGEWNTKNSHDSKKSELGVSYAGIGVPVVGEPKNSVNLNFGLSFIVGFSLGSKISIYHD